MTDYVAIANRPSTLREKESALRVHLLPAFGHMKLSQITANVIDAAVARWLRDGMSIKRANNIMTIFRKSFNCAVEWGLIARATAYAANDTGPQPMVSAFKICPIARSIASFR